jgi:hypothetical protein
VAGGEGNRAISIGISVCAMISDAIIATTIGIATCVRKIVIWLRDPKRMGRNTTMHVAVPASVATPTSRTPASVALSGRVGSICRWR